MKPYPTRPTFRGFISIPSVRVAHRDHYTEHVVPRVLIEHYGVRKHAAIPANVLQDAERVAIFIAQPGASVADDIEFAVGVRGLAVAAGFIVGAGAFHAAIVLGDMEIESPGPKRVGHFAVGFGEARSAEIEFLGKQAI